MLRKGRLFPVSAKPERANDPWPAPAVWFQNGRAVSGPEAPPAGKSPEVLCLRRAKRDALRSCERPSVVMAPGATGVGMLSCKLAPFVPWAMVRGVELVSRNGEPPGNVSELCGGGGAAGASGAGLEESAPTTKGVLLRTQARSERQRPNGRSKVVRSF